MKKINAIRNIVVLTFLIMLFNLTSVFGMVGDLGFFSGISEGRRPPKATELIVQQTGSAQKKNATLKTAYKEVLFVSGQPVEFTGTISINNGEAIKDTDMSGKYTVQYTVAPDATTPTGVALNRSITYTVTYARSGDQIIKNFTATSWTEAALVNGATYTLVPAQSHSDISIIEDHTPGVVYYKGNTTHNAVYIASGSTTAAAGTTGAAAAPDKPTTVSLTGTLYGYSCAWSNAETHRIDGVVDTPNGQLSYQIRPSVSIYKTLQYTKNEPTAISFEGNYAEVTQDQSDLTYNIFISPSKFALTNPASGSAHINTLNTFEQLRAPDTSYLKGHFAEGDISKLFSMNVLEGDPKFYQPSQAITRGQFVTALVKAVKLPIAQPAAATAKGKRATAAVQIVFPDVLPDRPDYPYIMAAYKAGLAVGRDDGNFYIDSPIERQEAIVILLRTLGLETLGLDSTPMTSFTDDSNIAAWSKREVYAANRAHIISGDLDGNFRPRDFVSKAEAAAFVNRLIDYMRSDLQIDYTEHITNYTN